jgi:hypothetical protein
MIYTIMQANHAYTCINIVYMHATRSRSYQDVNRCAHEALLLLSPNSWTPSSVTTSPRPRWTSSSCTMGSGLCVVGTEGLRLPTWIDSVRAPITSVRASNQGVRALQQAVRAAWRAAQLIPTTCHIDHREERCYNNHDYHHHD